MRINVFYAAVLLLVAPVGVFGQRAETNAPSIREIKVKVVIDESFVEWSSFLIRREFDGAAKYPDMFSRSELATIQRWRATTPERLAEKIIRKLSRRYERNFGIRITPIGQATRVVFSADTNRIAMDIEYLEFLNAQPCDGADLLVGITTQTLFSLDTIRVASKEIPVATGGAYPPSGRLFSAQWLYGVKDLDEIVDTLDHEIRHIFGAQHEKGIVITGTEKEKLYLQEGVELIQQNRGKRFMCAEPTKRL